MTENRRKRPDDFPGPTAADRAARIAGTIMLGVAVALFIAGGREKRGAADLIIRDAQQRKGLEARLARPPPVSKVEPDTAAKERTPEPISNLIRWQLTPDDFPGGGKDLWDYSVRLTAAGGFDYYVVESFPELSTEDRRRLIDFIVRHHMALRSGLAVASSQGVRSTSPAVLSYMSDATAPIHAEIESYFSGKIDPAKLVRLIELQSTASALASAGLFHDLNFYGIKPSPHSVAAILESFHAAGVTFPAIDAALRNRMMEPVDEATGLKPIIRDVIEKAGPALTPQQVQVLKNFSRRYE